MPAPSTINVSVSSLATLLAGRLQTTQFWSAAELALYVRQAIREFQVLTCFWRNRVQLQTTANTPFYDLHALGIIPFTVHDTDILTQVSCHLLEYGGGTNFLSTTQFVLTALTNAFDERREEILGDSRIVVTDYPNIPGPPPPVSRLTVSNGLIQIHRADWFDQPSQLWSLLNRSDDRMAMGFSYQWTQNPQLPLVYSVATTTPFQIQLIPPPNNTGVLDLLITGSLVYTYNSAAPQLIGIPDDAAWALPWGILASVLGQDSQSRDFHRSSYALSRFRTALEVLKTWPCVMQCWPGDFQAMPSSLHSLDHWSPGWRNLAQTLPTIIALGGRNLVVCSPVPDAKYNIALDCVVNSPASGTDLALFDCPSDIVTALLDNGQHLAAFKLGGVEFDATMEMYRNFIDVAQFYAARERAQVISWDALRSVTKREDAETPYEREAVVA